MKKYKSLVSVFAAFLLVMSFFAVFALRASAADVDLAHFADEYNNALSHGVAPETAVQEYISKSLDKYIVDYMNNPSYPYTEYQTQIKAFTDDFEQVASEAGFSGDVSDIIWEIQRSKGMETYAKAEAKKVYYNEEYKPKVTADPTNPGVTVTPVNEYAQGFEYYVIYYLGDERNPKRYDEIYCNNAQFVYDPFLGIYLLKCSYPNNIIHHNVNGRNEPYINYWLGNTVQKGTKLELIISTNIPFADETDFPVTPLETVTDFDPGTLSEEELNDLLDDFLKDFEFTNPDLSTVEGILRHIDSMLSSELAKEEPKLNLEELASALGCHCITAEELNAAILGAVISDNRDTEIIAVLCEIRDSLQSGTSVGELNGDGELPAAADYGAVTDAINQQTASLSSKIDAMILAINANTVGDAINSGGEAVRDLASEVLDGLDSDDQDGIVNIIESLVTYSGALLLQQQLNYIAVNLLNTGEPFDVTFSLPVFGVENMVILRAADFTEGGPFYEGVHIAQSFATIFLVVGWLKVMRPRVFTLMEVFSR
jgi:hypothetical protein